MKLESKTLRPLTLDSEGTYISVLPTEISAKEFMRIAEFLPIEEPELDELHCTLIYSPENTLISPVAVNARMYSAVIDDVKFWKSASGKGYVVVTLTSPQLMTRHKEWLNQGLIHTYDDYTPHVTLAEDVAFSTGLEFAMISAAEAFKGKHVFFTDETLEGINKDYSLSQTDAVVKELAFSESRLRASVARLKATKHKCIACGTLNATSICACTTN